jgi:hypothetical protein
VDESTFSSLPSRVSPPLSAVISTAPAPSFPQPAPQVSPTDGPVLSAEQPNNSGDTCDEMRTEAQCGARARFLAAYAESPVIAPAARLAGVHRATVYRWRDSDPAFAVAMDQASEAYYAAHRAKVLAQQAERRAWRQRRNLELQEARRANLERARAAKGAA